MTISPRTMQLFSKLMEQGILAHPDISIHNYGPKVPNTGGQDYAAYMLEHTSGNPKVSKALSQSLASRNAAEGEKASLLSKLFDTLSIPLYSAANIVDNTVHSGANLAADIGIPVKGAHPHGIGKDLLNLAVGQPKAALGGAVRTFQASPVDNGLSAVFPGFKNDVNQAANALAPKKTGQNLLHEFGVNNKFARYGGGLALDFAMDPLSYVGGFMARGKDAGQAISHVLDAKAAAGMPLNKAFATAKAEQAGFKLPEVALHHPPVAEAAVRSPIVPRMLDNPAQIQTPRVVGGTPLMDAAQQAIQFAPKTRKLQRFIDSGQQAERLAQRDSVLASDVEKGLVNVPAPARDAVQKMQRAQADWERAMIKSGQVADKTGRVSVRAANQIVNDIMSGKTARYAINAPKATGEQAIKARAIADEVIDSSMGQKFNPASNRWHLASGKMIARRLPGAMPPGKQISLFNNILRHGGLSSKDPAAYDTARQMLASAEDHLISLGVNPTWHNGVRVRLSDVIEATHNQVPFHEILNDFAKRDMSKMNPAVRAAINGLSAQRSITMSEITANLTQMADRARENLINFTPIERPAVEDNIIQTSIEQAMKNNMTPAEIGAVKDLVKNVVDLNKLPADKWVLNTVAALHKAQETGTIRPELISKFNQAVAEGVGISYKTLGHRVTDNKAIDTIMTHMTTWWGRGEWRQLAQDVFDVGFENAAKRATFARNIVQKYPPEQISAAWRHAAGVEVATDPAITDLATVFHNYMRQVYKVGDNGIMQVNKLTKELSVGERSMALMEDVNRHLKDMNGAKAFQFIKKRQVHHPDFPTAPVKDYSGPGDWMKSWELANPTDPVSFLYDLDLAMERTTKEYAFMDDFVGRFGSLKEDAVHNWAVPHARIKGFFVPQDVGLQFTRVMEDLQKGNWRASDPITRFLSRGLRIWKTGVTIYLPSHHIRNLIGDTYLMWLSGHNDVRSFIWAKRIMASQRTKYTEALKRADFNTLEQLTSPEAIKWAETRGGDVIINQNGVRLTADQLYVSAYQHGLLKDAYAYEDIFGQAPLGEISTADTGLKKFVKQPLGGKAHDVATTAAEYREHYIRIAHFTAAVNKGLKRSKNLQQVMEKAAAEVRKWHPDGRDMTYFEQKYLRNLIPFYSWTRKSIPLLIQGLVTRPAKQLAYPRSMLALQGMLGTPGGTIADPYPNDQLFPEWIRAYGIAPIGNPASDNIIGRWWGNLGRNMVDKNGNPYGYTLVNPSNPFVDTGQQFLGFGPQDTAKGIWDSVNPFIKVPAELATGHDFTNAPIYKRDQGQGMLHYLSKQIPFTSPIQRVTNAGDRQRLGVQQQGFDSEALLNMLTAIGIRGTGPYIKSGEYELKDRLKAAKK